MNETLEQARERYQASLTEADFSKHATAVVHHSKQRPGEDVDQRRTIVPIATKRTSPPRKDIPSQRVKPEVVEEGDEEEKSLPDGHYVTKPGVPAFGPYDSAQSAKAAALKHNPSHKAKAVYSKGGEFQPVEEGMEEEVPMTEAQKKFVEGLKAGADCYTTQVDGGRLVRSQKSEGDTTSAPGADEGKPAPKKMADLLKEAKAKFAENIINNSAPSPGSFSQAKATFAEGLKNHCNKGK